ncbi:hypothetical protein NUW54_g6678 [Trametes sanguinea]|uniref:Uncharacterized protein n=1 Tax=Trametes sanguinea TaxID=158606 RepID=A0ACC1PTN5_9APHY|nr:hypothetical protein NUW54_g6678 [Trametes sanguinea]
MRLDKHNEISEARPITDHILLSLSSPIDLPSPHPPHSHPLRTSPTDVHGARPFTLSERKAFGLTGRLPHRVNTLEEQCQRAYDQLSSRSEPLRKNTFMQSLKDQNWVLYYGLLSRHVKELIPIIYTPTQGDAIANYSHLFRRSEGLYLTFPEQDSMEEDFLELTAGRDIQLFVVTDSEAILGIGDQGVGGIGIATAKSAIYTLLGGMDPSKTLPVVLDVGTDNEQLLKDNLYVGWPNKRIRGKAYDRFVDQFVQLVRKHYPHSLLHFEDFGVGNAQRLLDIYRNKHAVFNDDVQGTGAVTLAAMMSAVVPSNLASSNQAPPVFSTVQNAMGTTEQVHTSLTNPVSTLTDANSIMLSPTFSPYSPTLRVAAAYVRVRGAPAIFGRRIIVRKKYQVAGPNSLVHHDGQHGLIRWKFVTHCFIDGYARFVTGIRVHTNNRADTVLSLFLESIADHGIPSRVRGDHGTENIRVAEWMEATRGLNRGSYIWGRSVHNTRIERLWYDVTQGYGAKWKSFFLELEHSHGLDADRPAHIWLIHHLFLNALNADAQEWANTWNAHRLHIAGEQAASPRELFMFGMVRHGPRGIEHIVNAADDVLEADDVTSYGIDWDVNDDPVLMAHHQTHNGAATEVDQGFGVTLGPAELSEVTCDPPRCPLTAREVILLDTHLAHHFDCSMRGMEGRRILWLAALEFCTHADLIGQWEYQQKSAHSCFSPHFLASATSLIDCMPRRPAVLDQSPPTIRGLGQSPENVPSARSLWAARRACRATDISAQQPAQQHPQPASDEVAQPNSLQVVDLIASSSIPADESDSGLSTLTDDSVRVTESDPNELLGKTSPHAQCSQNLESALPQVQSSPSRANTPSLSVGALEEAYVDYDGGHHPDIVQDSQIPHSSEPTAQHPDGADSIAATMPAASRAASGPVSATLIEGRPQLPFCMPSINLAHQHHLHICTVEAYLPSAPHGSPPSHAVQPVVSCADSTEGMDLATSSDGDQPTAAGQEGLYTISEAVCGYLDGAYSAEAALLAQLYSAPLPYGSAYSEVLQIRLIRKIFDHLRITTGSRGKRKTAQVLLPGGVELSISTLDVVRWAHINTLKSYANARKRVTRIHALQHWLRHASPETLDADDTRVLNMLTHMCRPDKLLSMQEVDQVPDADPALAFAVMQAGRPLEAVLLKIVEKKGIQKAQLPNFTALL